MTKQMASMIPETIDAAKALRHQYESLYKNITPRHETKKKKLNRVHIALEILIVVIPCRPRGPQSIGRALSALAIRYLAWLTPILSRWRNPFEFHVRRCDRDESVGLSLFV
jgi:hypothetical protein